MPSVPSFIVSITSVSQEDKDKSSLFGTIADVIGKIADFGQVFTVVGIIPAGATVVSLLKDAFFPSGAPSDRQVLDSIAEKLDHLIRFEHGFQQHVDMLEIDQIVGASSTRLETLFDAGTPDSPDVDRPGTIQDTLNAANLLGSRDFWVRPFFEEMVYPRGDLGGHNFTHVVWFGETRQSLKPPVDPETEFVFDPRIAFPAYIKAIENRICALSIIHPGDFQQVFATEFSNPTPDPIRGPGRAEVLTDRYNEMLSGLLTARFPTPAEILTLFDERPASVEIIQTWGGTFGVVDIFSGSALFDLYPIERLFPPNWALDVAVIRNSPRISDDQMDVLFAAAQHIQDNYPALVARLTLGVLVRKKALYIVRGLHHAWEVIQKLKQLGSRSDIQKIDLEAVWSLREINAILGSLFLDTSGFFDPTQSVRRTIGQLSRLANLPTSESLSLRDALDKASP